MSTLIINNSIKENLPNVYATNYVKNNDGTSSYTLHVEGRDFTGTVYTRMDAQENIKLCNVSYSPYGQPLSITGLTGQHSFTEHSEVVTIPVGVYNCTINLSAVDNQIAYYAEAQALIEYLPDYPVGSGLRHLEALWVDFADNPDNPYERPPAL